MLARPRYLEVNSEYVMVVISTEDGVGLHLEENEE